MRTSVVLLAGLLLGCSQIIPPDEPPTVTAASGAPHVAGVALGTERATVGTDTLTVTFSEPMNPSLVTIGDYTGEMSCDEYGAIESIQVSIDQRPGELERDARCIGGALTTEDGVTYTIRLNARIGRGDVVWVHVIPNTSVSVTPTSVPVVEPVTDAEGESLAHGFSARFDVRAAEFALLSPAWSADDDRAFESFEPVELER